jgi:hypothetical protein
VSVERLKFLKQRRELWMSMQFDDDAKAKTVEEVPKVAEETKPISPGMAVKVNRRKVVELGKGKQPGPYEDIANTNPVSRRGKQTGPKQRNLKQTRSNSSAFTVADMSIWNGEDAFNQLLQSSHSQDACS